MTTKEPNILILWGDDIGQFNVSCYNNGMMGCKTPNIDRIAKEGALFPDGYGQQSAGLLKNHGYMTGQFGKNHLGGDRTLAKHLEFKEVEK